jgi:hypothetical protein
MQIAYRLVRATQTPKKEKLKNIPVEKPMPAIISQVYLLTGSRPNAKCHTPECFSMCFLFDIL